MRTLIRLGLFMVLGFGFVSSLPCAAQNSDPSVLAGTWILNLAKSKPDKRFPIKSQTLVVSYAAPMMTFKFTTDGKDLPVVWTVDDKEHMVPNPAFPNAQTIFKATWKKGALVTDNNSRMGSPGNQITTLIREERWTLSADGKVLTEKSGGDNDWDHTYVFEKQ
jgi:hypothetical protein